MSVDDEKLGMDHRWLIFADDEARSQEVAVARAAGETRSRMVVSAARYRDFYRNPALGSLQKLASSASIWNEIGCLNANFSAGRSDEGLKKNPSARGTRFRWGTWHHKAKGSPQGA